MREQDRLAAHREVAALQHLPPRQRAVLILCEVLRWKAGEVAELLDMSTVDRITVKVRVPVDEPTVPSVTPDWPTADHQEREIFDMFGVVFEGHPDLRRILLPEDYVGWPQRRDFPIGGEPVTFTYSEGRYD